MPSEWFETFFEGPAVDFWASAIETQPTAKECDFLESALDLKPGARVLDVPCGNGRHSIELARRGYRVTGVDLSAEFLAAAERSARQAGVDVELQHGDMRNLNLLDEFNAAFCFGNSFCYLDHARACTFLRTLAGVIRPGGRLAIATATAAESILPELRPQRWHRFGDLVVLSEARYAAADSRLDIDYTFVRDGRIETRPTSSFVFTAAEYRRMIESAGFEVLAMNGGMAGEPFERKPGWLVLTATKS